jgi:hypothetical protein
MSKKPEQSRVVNLSAASDGAAARASGEDVTARIIPAKPLITKLRTWLRRPRARGAGRPAQRSRRSRARSPAGSTSDPDLPPPRRPRCCGDSCGRCMRRRRAVA